MDWLGRVAVISVTDVMTGEMRALKLSTPFAPIKEVGKPRKLRLRMVCSPALNQHELG